MQSIDIVNLVIWTFQNECGSLGGGGPVGPTAYPKDSIIRCEEVSVAGGFIVSSPGSNVVHDDAFAVTNALADRQVFDEPTARLVAAQGKSGQVPDWRPYAYHRMDPVTWIDEGTGEPYAWATIVPEHERSGWAPRREWCPVKRKTLAVPVPRWCPIVERDSDEVVDQMRNRYLAWAIALRDLGEMLRGRLRQWSLADAYPDPHPWLEQQSAA